MNHLTIFRLGLHWSQEEDTEVEYHGYSERRQFEPREFWNIADNRWEILKKRGPGAIQETFKCNAAQFVQSWLFFALLSLFLDEDVDPLTFTTNDSQHLTTIKLPATLDNWKQRMQSYKPDEQKRCATRIDTALERASQFICKWHEDTSCVPENLWLSVATLGETLAHAKAQVWPSQDTGYWHVADERRWGEHRHITTSLIASGWCPSSVCAIRQSMGGISGPVVTRTLSPNSMHHTCSGSACTAYTKSNPPCHTDDCDKNRHPGRPDKCRLLDVLSEKVLEILNEGHFPVIRLGEKRVMMKGQETNVDTIEVASSEKLPKYVAISHVWIDGLGNSKNNALPLCQLKTLQDMVNLIMGHRSVLSNTYFWLDTICVPVGPSRDKGIRSMKRVYQEATRVLVRDNDLRNCSQTEGLEPLIRINLSKWVTRLWTLQEAYLSKDLCFEFGGKKTLRMEDLEERLNEAGSHLHLSWLKAARLFGPTMESLRNQLAETKVKYVWQAVNERTCYHSMDETICIASLLDLDQTSLLEARSASERMCRFLSLLDYIGIPAGLIFIEGERLKEEGFRWAPSSWMNRLGQRFPYPMSKKRDHPSLLMRNGLLVQYPGIILTIPTILRGNTITIWTEDDGMAWYKLEYGFQQGDDSTDLPPWSYEREVEKWTPAVILCRLPVNASPEIALLVSIVHSRDDIKWAHRICLLRIKSISSPGEIQEAQRLLHNDKGTVPGTVLREQKWCVDGLPVIVSWTYLVYTWTNQSEEG
jgi:hypothetical protein